MVVNKFRISIDKVSWEKKPSDKPSMKNEDYLGNPRSDIQMIGGRIAQGVETVTQKELEKYIQLGYTWSPNEYGVCPKWKKRRRLNDLWLGAQAISIDFDNNISHYNEIIDTLAAKKLVPSFIHETFSHSPEHPKYRAVMLMEHQETDVIKYYEYLYYFAKVFEGKLDTQCLDLARIFYGGPFDCVVYSSDARISSDVLRPRIGDDIKERIEEKFAKSRRSYLRIAGNTDVIDISDPEDALKKQQEALEHLDWETRARIANKINQELRLLKHYKGQFGSRYQVVWNTSRAFGQIGPIALNVAYLWIRRAIAENKYFHDYDKDVHEIVEGGLKWGRDHVDDEVHELGYIHHNK